jgi:hypothetical protein
MKKLGVISILAVMLGAVGCAPSVTVSHDRDPTADLSGLRDYRWLPQRTSAALLDARVKAAVNDQLFRKGYLGEAARPDFYVAYYVGARDRIDVTTWGYGYRRTDVREYTEGTLIVDVIDARTMQLVWRSFAQGTLDPSASPQDRDQRLRAAVTKMLKEFPSARG